MKITIYNGHRTYIRLSRLMFGWAKTVEHTELGDRHLSELSGKDHHRKITLEAQYDRNVTLESKVLRQSFIDLAFQIIICDHPC